MRAMIIEQCGGPEAFAAADIDKPNVRPGHVLVRVQASSVNPIDAKVRAGDVPLAPALPAVLHGDVVGEVVAVGAGVDRFDTGDRVYGCAGGFTDTPGALAEFMRCDADLLAKVPRAWDELQAAAMPLVGITAWEMLDRAGLPSGETVLIHGGAGGVGHVLVQVARARGLRVHTTVSRPEKVELAREVGAETVIVTRDQQVADYVAEHTGGTGYAAVFDTKGGKTLAASFDALASGGQVITIAARCTVDLTALHAVAGSLHTVFMLQPLLSGQGRRVHGEILASLADLADAGRLEPVLDERVFDFAEVGQAHALLASGDHVGKVVLRGFGD